MVEIKARDLGYQPKELVARGVWYRGRRLQGIRRHSCLGVKLQVAHHACDLGKEAEKHYFYWLPPQAKLQIGNLEVETLCPSTLWERMLEYGNLSFPRQIGWMMWLLGIRQGEELMPTMAMYVGRNRL